MLRRPGGGAGGDAATDASDADLAVLDAQIRSREPLDARERACVVATSA